MNQRTKSSQAQRVIVHLLASPFFGGPEWQVLGLANHLDPSYRCVFLSFLEHGRARPFLDRVRAAGHRAEALRHNAPQYVSCVREVAARLRELRAEVLCCHGYKPDLIGLLAGKLARVPVISVCHGWTGATWKVRLNEAADRLSLHGMDRVVCVSEGQARKVRACAVPSRKIVVIQNAIDASRFASSGSSDRSELQALFPRPVSQVVVAAGRLSPEKGFADLIRAAALTVAAGREFGFVLFGDGPLRAELERQIIDCKLQDRFILAGFRSDIDRLLPLADVLAMSSYTEGLPSVALEAHAAAIPIVATKVGGIPEVVLDGVTGRLTTAGDYQALSQNLIDLLQDPDLRQMMGARGMEHVQSHFTFEGLCKKYEKLFEDVLRAGRAQRAASQMPLPLEPTA